MGGFFLKIPQTFLLGEEKLLKSQFIHHMEQSDRAYTYYKYIYKRLNRINIFVSTTRE